LGIKILVLVAIFLIPLFIVPAFAENNVVIYDVKSLYPNLEVRLLNPSDNSINLSGWEIISTLGNTNPYTLSGSIGAWDCKKIILQSIDNEFFITEYGSLILKDNNGKIVHLTPNIDYGWKNRDFSVCRLPFTIIQTSEVIALDTFYNSDYGVSIKYPQNWYVDDEVIEWDPIPEFDDGSVSIVMFSDSPDFSGISIDLTLIKNDVYARNYQDDEYIQQIKQLQKSTCVDDRTIEYRCRDYSSISAQKLYLDYGHPAYQITERYKEAYADESLSQRVGILTDIIYGTDVWSIYASSFESDYQYLASIMEEMVYTFDFNESVYALGQEGCHYKNEVYEFSFNVPCDWVYWENLQYGDIIAQVVHIPSNFEGSGQQGLLGLFSGLPFSIDAPQIAVIFENIAESKIPQMNTQEIKKYERESMAMNLPSAKIIDLDVKSTSWGWIASAKIHFSIGQSQLISEGNTYYFKDRESYAIGYSSGPQYYDTYHPALENALETLEINGIKVNEPEPAFAFPSSGDNGGGCLIATATFGSELAPQVQMLREIRDNSLLQTESGSAFMESFNQFYYSFSPTIADLERENPVFKEAVKVTITPLVASLSLLNYVDLDSEESVLGYGIGIILMNVGMYFVAPIIVISKLKK